MANDKRHPMSTDMNDIDLNDENALTDEESRALRSMSDAGQGPDDPKKAM